MTQETTETITAISIQEAKKFIEAITTLRKEVVRMKTCGPWAQKSNNWADVETEGAIIPLGRPMGKSNLFAVIDPDYGAEELRETVDSLIEIEFRQIQEDGKK